LTAARLTIDLDALARNYAFLSAKAAPARIAPVLKADGYGLGAGVLARRLWAEGARAFYVARLSEGEALRAELGDRAADILILDGAPVEDFRGLQAARLTPVLSTLDQALAWDGGPAPLHVDTGMNRLGVSWTEAEILAARGFRPSLVMSHLGSAADPDDPRNPDQLARFEAARALFPGVPASLAASAGIFLGPDYHFDEARPGISLLGGGPHDVPDPQIATVATLEAPILQVRTLLPGEQAGYGSMFTATKAMRLAMVAAGYADGVIRRSHGSAAGYLGGKRLPIATVSMDLIGLDASACPEAVAGAPVELLGPNAQLDDLAAAAGSVSHEILVRLSPRAERLYVGAEP
jgi:alanine racemase